MSLEETNDTIKTPPRKSSRGVITRNIIRRRAQLKRKNALEEKRRLYGTLSDVERGRLRELQMLYD